MSFKLTYATMFDPDDLALPANVPDHFNYDRKVVTQADVHKMLANYLGKIALCDDCLGRLIEAMKARGTWDNCLFIFTSDHGEMMGSHGALSKGRFWEESARVPLVVRSDRAPAERGLRSQADPQMWVRGFPQDRRHGAR